VDNHAEGVNAEVARQFASSHANDGPRMSLRAELLEIAEAVVLALVAVATAWSGYHAARWNGHQALMYGTSTRLRTEAAAAATEGGQKRLLDVVTFNTWIQAREANDEKLAAIYTRRFSPEYRVAFDAWLTTQPLTNREAPPGPIWMPEYHNALLEQAARLNQEATATFSEGTEGREIAERYLHVTVLLATVLFLIALAQRFKLRQVRVGLFLVAFVLMVYALGTVATYPRL
jgi:hypothetical protein